MKNVLITIALLGAVTFASLGCSESNPVAPSGSNQIVAALATADTVHFAARVATTDQNRRMLTFEGQPDSVVAAHDCNIVRLKGGTEAPVPFNSIRPGDSVNVHGTRTMAGYVYAYHLRICQDMRWEIAFRDTIVTIDYAAGSFMVAGRTETIVIDENTYIWGTLLKRQEMVSNRVEHQYRFVTGAGMGEGDGNHYRYTRCDTALEFTDLQVGDVIEVRAVAVDPNTLRAVFIKLADCANIDERCVQFEAVIASLDLDARSVTFEGVDEIGVVCQGAKLTDADGNLVTLADFAIGMLVSVKAQPVDGFLKICQMTML